MARSCDCLLDVRPVPNERASGTKQSDAVVEAEGELADTGRIVLRASGTEPVIRVMVEGQDPEVVDTLARRLAEVVADAATRAEGTGA